MSPVGSVDGNVYYRATLRAVVPLGTDAFHELLVTDAHFPAFNNGTYSLPGYLLDVVNTAAVTPFLWESLTQSLGNGVGGVMLYVGRHVQQMGRCVVAGVVFGCGGVLTAAVARVAVDCFNGKLPPGEGSRLVEDHGSNVREHVEEVGSLDEYAFA